LKPDNVFITTDGRVKILDFGVAKLTQPDTALSGLTVMPTTPGAVRRPYGHGRRHDRLYVAGARSRRRRRPRSDIFSLGVLLHEILSGQRTFSGETAADVMSGILRQDAPELPVTERHIPQRSRASSTAVSRKVRRRAFSRRATSPSRSRR
jgi:serine/threonine-protein kinase